MWHCVFCGELHHKKNSSKMLRYKSLISIIFIALGVVLFLVGITSIFEGLVLCAIGIVIDEQRFQTSLTIKRSEAPATNSTT